MLSTSERSASNQIPEVKQRLIRAHQHVSKMWIPVNPKLFAKVRKGILQGDYDFDYQSLVIDIKSDVSLFTYCVRELAKDQDPDGPRKVSALSLLEKAGLAKLKELLNVELGAISTHSFDASAKVNSLKNTLIAASTAEVLAPFYAVDPNTGFSAAVLRQLGLTLIAWNYPSVYKRALEAQKEGITLETALSSALGFSPLSLTVALITSWQIPLDACGLEHGAHVPPKSIGAQIKKICEVGEALARANDPENYPTAAHDWDLAKSEIVKVLGVEGFSKINQQVKHTCSSYADALPESFKDTEQLDPEKKIHVYQQALCYDRNPYLDQCTPGVRRKAEHLYAHLNNNGISRDNLAVLIREVIPVSGFAGGAIYVVEPSNMTLFPRARFGTTERDTSKTLSITQSDEVTDPILEAYRCASPIVDNYRSAKEVSSICASLGTENKVGVLYLEAPMFSLADANAQLLTHFKAIRQLLVDCLGVK